VFTPFGESWFCSVASRRIRTEGTKDKMVGGIREVYKYCTTMRKGIHLQALDSLRSVMKSLMSLFFHQCRAELMTEELYWTDDI
jgi:hypothetical protein